jgi:hypothetical protein
MSSRAHQQSTNSTAVVERVLGIRKAPTGNGQQYEIKWQGQQEATWEAASRIRRQIPDLVRAFEESLQQQQNDVLMEDVEEDAANGEEGVADRAIGNQSRQLAADGSDMRAQMEAMQQLLREQAQQLQQLRASPTHSPQSSPRVAESAAAAAAVAPAAPRRKEPRLSDLSEYNGASGDKLDAWLAELRRCARYYQLGGSEAVEFAVVRLRDSADIWWAALSSETQAEISSVEALAAALRGRFQPVTTARVAREKLHALQQGGRHVDDYIAEFQKLHAQVPDMAEPDARAQFMRGLRRELATKLEDADWESMPLVTVISKAARIGGRTAPTVQPPTVMAKASVNQMDVDDGADMEDRIARSVLNALQSQSSGAGLGAKTQTQRGYNDRVGGASGRGGVRFGGGRGGRFGNRGSITYNIPGVPAALVEQRRAAGQCLRCGSGDHRGMECPNAPSATQPSN